MTRYCFINSGSWQYNAATVRLRELGSALIQLGLEVAYVIDDVEYNRTRLGLHPDAQVHFVSDPGFSAQFRARRRILDKLQPDFVHVQGAPAKVFMALVGSRHKLVGDFDEWAPDQPNMARRVREAFLYSWLRRRCSVAVACSKYLQDYCREHYRFETAYIPYATYLPDYPDGASPYDEPTLVYMGNLFKEWDHDVVFEAALRLKAKGKMPRFVMMGTGPDLEKWREFVLQKGLTNISLPGFVTGEDLWRHLRHAHVLLFPIRPTRLNRSRCPSKTFAYAQARRPVITCRVGEVPGVLGEGARYVECSPEAFAEAIEDAMASPVLPDVNYGIERHTWKVRAEALIEAIRAAGA